MSGNGTTGGKISPNYKASLWTVPALGQLLDSLRANYRLLGPVGSGVRALFREVGAAAELNLEGGRTMIPPARAFFFRARQELLHFNLGSGATVQALPATAATSLLVGIRPCDTHSLLYLDNIFSADPHYRAIRRRTLLLTVNCLQPSRFCFCSSVGTGPFFGQAHGSDAILTSLGAGYLVEPLSEPAAQLFGPGEPAQSHHWREKEGLSHAAHHGISKQLELTGRARGLRLHKNHQVWARVAEERCLSCANCVMVCPTCFCHDVREQVDMGLGEVTRYRCWDACQDLEFAAVHGGNFRRSREARLRQFVLHKLDYTEQYGQPGTVGCGRCIEWCPTNIDLTEIAKEIWSGPGEKPLPAV